LILEFGERCLRGQQTQFESGVISKNQLYICWRFFLKEPVSSVGQDRVYAGRSCVDFIRSAQAEIVCQFRQKFIGVQLRFEKSSLRWRIVEREENKYIKEFFTLIGRDSAEIGSQKERERSSQQAMKQGPIDHPVDRCAQLA